MLHFIELTANSDSSELSISRKYSLSQKILPLSLCISCNGLLCISLLFHVIIHACRELIKQVFCSTNSSRIVRISRAVAYCLHLFCIDYLGFYEFLWIYICELDYQLHIFLWVSRIWAICAVYWLLWYYDIVIVYLLSDLCIMRSICKSSRLFFIGYKINGRFRKDYLL